MWRATYGVLLVMSTNMSTQEGFQHLETSHLDRINIEIMMNQLRVVVVVLLLNYAIAFISSTRSRIDNVSFQKNSFQQLFAVQLDSTKTSGSRNLGSRTSIESYKHKDFKLTYLYKQAAPGREKDKPIVLIHPVGIGIASWFWTKLLEAYDDNPPIYAPDLIGCGLDHGADAWDPNKTGLFFPLSWVEGVEKLIQTIVIPRWQQQPSWINLFGNTERNTGNSGCLIIAQGGLAPVGIMLAKRNPLTVGDLMLTSPPSYVDVTSAVPEKELERNYNLLRSPILGSFAFAILESKEIIRFFSNLFLFADECDEQWLDETQRESCRDARPPVQAFNAGLLQHRSFEEELKELNQHKLIVSGDCDKRVVDRQLYGSKLNQCTLKTIRGLNVMPWENPSGVIELVRELGY